MPCTAPPRGKTDNLVQWLDWIDNDPCGKPTYAGSLCLFHWEMANGLVAPGAAGDPATVLLLHGETLMDVKGHPITPVGDAKVDTAQSVFGGSSYAFDGSGDYLTTPDSPDWAFGAGDLTVDFWVRFTQVAANQTFIGQRADPSDRSWSISFLNTNQLRFLYSLDGSAVVSPGQPWAPVINTWYHVAVVRIGTIMRMFVNGTQIGVDITINGALFDSTAPLQIGAELAASAVVSGWLDEIRISKGIARWTSNFSVPTAPYT